MFEKRISSVAFREDLPFLLNDLGLTGIGAEIGVQQGTFSNHILTYWKGKKLYLIDAWRHFKDGYEDIGNVNHNEQLNNLAKTFMTTYHFGNKVAIIKELSLEAANIFQNEVFDFVYIDANHNYESTKNDLQAWYPKVKKGGIFCGHDYINSSFEDNGIAEFGVKKAVDEFALSLNTKVFKTCGNTKSIEKCEPIETWFIKV